MNPPWQMVKVGGSLLSHPDLGRRLQTWLGHQPHSLLLVGGGPTTDLIRQAQANHGFSEQAAHDLAIRALGFNAHWLATMLPEAMVVQSFAEFTDIWQRGVTPILDPSRSLIAQRPDSPGPGGRHNEMESPALSALLPIGWHVTSDSIAAFLAEQWGADRLILLKSCPPPHATDRTAWAAASYVDPYFPIAAAALTDVQAIGLFASPD